MKVTVIGGVQNTLAVLQRALEARGLVIEAGFPGEMRGEKHDGNPDAPSVLQVAVWNEFGTDNAPPRPFMRQTLKRHGRKLNRQLAEALRGWIYGRATDDGLAKVGRRMGILLRGAIQETITKGEYVPNAPYTIAKKGSSKPLIDTGQMRQSVRWQVRRRGRITDRGGPKR